MAFGLFFLSLHIHLAFAKHFLIALRDLPFGRGLIQCHDRQKAAQAIVMTAQAIFKV